MPRKQQNDSSSKDFFDYDELPKVAYSPDLVRAIGDLKAAIFLTQLLFYLRVYERRHGGERPEWYFRRRADIEIDTALTRYEQEGARKRLRELLILEERKGHNYNTRFRINYEMLLKVFPSGGISPSRVGENPPVDWGKTSRPAGGISPSPLMRLNENKNETAEKPGPGQADLPFSAQDEISRLFAAHPFPWKEQGDKANEKIKEEK